MPFPRPEGVRPRPLSDLRALVGTLDTSLAPASGSADPSVTGVCLATSELRPGDLWAALPGARTHGARFAAAAEEAGAVAVLTDPEGEQLLRAGSDLPSLVVTDPRALLGRVSAAVYATSDLPLRRIGITGTNGKTTTAYLIDSALHAMGRTSGLIGTIETRIGDERIPSVRTTPESTDLHALLAVMGERAVDDCVMEVSSHALSLHRVDGVVYDLAVFLNLSQDHLDFHGSMEEYFEAKASLFTPELSRRGVVCVDDEWGRRLAQRGDIPMTTVTSTPGASADWVISGDPAESTFALTGAGIELVLRSSLPGDFNRVNTAMAAVALITLGHPPEVVVDAVLTPPFVPGRMERVEVPAKGEDLPLGIVDFAHTPDAVAGALRALRPVTPGTLVVVTGSGGSRDPGKRPAMGRVAATHADVVVVSDDNPRYDDPADIRAAVLAGAHEVAGARVEEVPGRLAAIARAVQIAHDGQGRGTVALLGKGHETGQEIGGEIRPHDDRVALREAIEALEEAR